MLICIFKRYLCLIAWPIEIWGCNLRGTGKATEASLCVLEGRGRKTKAQAWKCSPVDGHFPTPASSPLETSSSLCVHHSAYNAPHHWPKCRSDAQASLKQSISWRWEHAAPAHDQHRGCGREAADGLFSITWREAFLSFLIIQWWEKEKVLWYLQASTWSWGSGPHSPADVKLKLLVCFPGSLQELLTLTPYSPRGPLPGPW